MRWHLNHARFGNEPWAVQAEAMRRADGAQRYGWFLEQGLGKTALALNDFIDTDHCDLNIVIPPSSFIGDWPLAPDEWGVGFLQTGMWDGKDNFPTDWEQGLWCVSHETLRGSKRARDGLIKLLKARRCMVTFDEATGIKNPQSLLAKFMMTEVSKYAQKIRLLDGTPMVQNVMDYYPKLRCLGELNGVNPYAFRNRFAIMGGFMGKQIKGIRPENQDELARILDRVSFRALKKDWRKDMPPQLDVPVHLEMTDNQRRHYRTMMADFYAELEGTDITVWADLVLTQRQKLQQISSCYVRSEGTVHWIEEPKNNPKLKATFDLMESGQGKSIISYIEKPSGKMLIDEYTKAGLNPAWIVGGMKPEEITFQKRKFNDDADCRVLVGQQDITSRGHTLLGQKGKDRCFRLFMYENSPSLMHRLQMRDRNHRGEQDETCVVYDLICHAVDQNQVDILTGKKSAADGMDELVKMVREKKW